MTHKEMSDWIEKHICIGDRVAELYAMYEDLDASVDDIVKCYELQRKSTDSTKRTLYRISRLCMNSKNPEKTLETIFSLATDIYKQI